MAGYDWSHGMSNNAVAAYEDGEKPLSRWTKKDILEGIEEAYDDEDVKAAAKKLALSDLKRIFLICSGWHHTSKYYNCTDFYSVDDSICLADISDYLADKRAGESAIKLLAKREKWLKSHAWHVQHAVWTDSRGKCTDSGKVQKSGAFFADHAEEAVKAELDRLMPDIPSWLPAFMQQRDLEKSFSGKIYPAGRKPSRWDYEGHNFFRQGEHRISQGVATITLQEYRGSEWLDVDTYKPATWLAIPQVLAWLESRIIYAPSVNSSEVEMDGIRAYTQQELHWLAAHGKVAL